MKKLIVAFAAAIMALGVQAAAVEWSSGVFNGPDGSSSKTGSAYSDVYTALFSIYSDAAGGTLLGSDTTSAVNKKGLMKGSVDMTEPSSGVTKTYYTTLVITDTATGKTLSTEMGSFTWTGGDLTAPSLTFFGDGAGGFAGSAPAVSGGGWASGGTPEPTSGLLLLVGGAMLALRRKQK